MEMRTGTIFPATLLLILGTVAAGETYSIGADWMMLLSMVLVAYGIVLFAHAFDR